VGIFRIAHSRARRQNRRVIVQKLPSGYALSQKIVLAFGIESCPTKKRLNRIKRERRDKTLRALPCPEIGLKWFLFALHHLGTALCFVSFLDFSGDFVLLEHRTNGQTGIKTIFDHLRRARWPLSSTQETCSCKQGSQSS
jgi:hypothetical protein